MGAEKTIFAALVCVALLAFAFMAMSMQPKQPVAFFAYGPNLAKSTMNSRAGGFINATAAKLQGYSLSFESQDGRPTEFGVANAVPGNGSVLGALYYLTQEQMATLDRQMSAPNFYERREVTVTMPDGSSLRAQAYFLSGSTHIAAPSRPYYLAAQGGLAGWGYGDESIIAAMAAAAPN